MELAEYVARYPASAPVRQPIDAADAYRLLEEEDGVRPFPQCVEGMISAPEPGENEGRHLWVIHPDGIPSILETGPDVKPPPLSLGVAKHTNLTGGAPACAGGEVWLDAVNPRKLHLNGGSGRYQIKSPEQLAETVKVFEALGFEVRSAGWSEDNHWPEKKFR